MSLIKLAVDKIGKYFPEVEDTKEDIKIVVLIIVIDILLIPMYFNWPTLYFISLLLHIQLYGGWHKMVQKLIKKVDDNWSETEVSSEVEDNE